MNSVFSFRLRLDPTLVNGSGLYYEQLIFESQSQSLSRKGRELWTILLEEFKQRNTKSFFLKVMSDNGYVMSVHADCAKYLCQSQGLFEVQLLTWYLIFIIDFLTRVYIYMYLYVSPSREIHVQLGIYCYLLLFDIYLPAPTHFINLNFFILLGFLLSM